MAPASLVPCASCAQHVRDEETQCPFCGTRRVPGVRSLDATPQLDGRVLVPMYGGPPRPLQGLEATPHGDERVMAPMYGGPPRPASSNTALFIAIGSAVALVLICGAVALALR